MSAPSSPVPPSARRWAAAFWVVAALLVAPALLTLPLPVSFDSNEGWNALWATRLAHGEAIYFPPDQLLANNYPPLSMHLLALWPDPLLAGRVFAALGLFGTAAFAGLLAARLGGSGGLTAGLILAFAGAHHASYVAMNDPQWLAHAVMLAGLWLLVRAGPQPRTAVLVVAVTLMLAAGLIKHLLLPVPLAVTWWFARSSRLTLAWWLGLAAAGLAGGLGWLVARHGSVALDQILFSARGYSWAVGARSLLQWGAIASPLLVLGVAGARAAPAPVRPLLLAYLLLAGLLGAGTIGGEGVDRNAFFDLIIAASLGAGFAPAFPPRYRGWLLAATLLGAIVALPGRWALLADRRAAAVSWREDCAWLAQQPGPVVVHDLALAHWSGQHALAETFFFPLRLRDEPVPWLSRARAAPLWVISPRWPWTTAEEGLRLLDGYRVARRSPNGIFLVRTPPAGLIP